MFVPLFANNKFYWIEFPELISINVPEKIRIFILKLNLIVWFSFLTIIQVLLFPIFEYLFCFRNEIYSHEIRFTLPQGEFSLNQIYFRIRITHFPQCGCGMYQKYQLNKSDKIGSTETIDAR